MIKLTATDLNLFIECPRCAWRKINKKIFRPSKPFPSFINEFDIIIKNYFDKYRGKELPPILQGQLSGKLLNPKPKSIGFTRGDLNVWGIPDEFIEQDGTIAVLDHKTRNGPPNTAHPCHQLQMDVYAFIMQQKGIKTADYGYLVYYCPKDGELHRGLEIKATVKKIQLNTERIPDIIQQAIECLKAEEPIKGCEWCNC